MAENRFAKFKATSVPATGGPNRFSKFKKPVTPQMQAPVAPSNVPQTINTAGKGDRMAASPTDQSAAGFMGLADMLSFGFSDEVSGGIEVGVRKLQGDQRSALDIYNQFVGDVRNTQSELSAAAPSNYLGGQVLGGVATMGIGGGVNAAAKMLPRMYQGAKAGLVGGAAYGAGSGEGMTDTLQGGIAGGVTGGLVGGVLPAALTGARVPLSYMKSIVPGRSSRESFVARKIADKARQEGKDIQTISNELALLQKTNPDAVLIDALGPSGVRLGRAVVNKGGAGARELSETVYARQAGQNDRINSALSKGLGDPASYQKTLDESIDKLRSNAKPLYENAFAKSINYAEYGPQLTSVWKRVPPRLRVASVQAANDILIAEGKKAKRIGSVIGRGKDGKITPLPTIEQWDYIKRGLDAAIEAENTRGAAGGMSAIGRAVSNVKNDLVSVLDDAVPEYGIARKTFSDDLSVKKSLELGRESLNVDPELIEKQLKSLDNASRETFRVGYARSLADQINRMGAGQDAIARLWASPSSRKRLEVVFGNEKEFSKFAQFAVGEEKTRRTYKSLTGNSTTAQQLSDLNDAGNIEGALSFGEKIVNGNWVGATVGAISKSIRTLGGLTEARADEIARALASPSIPQGVVTRAGNYELSKRQRAVLSKLLTQGASRAASGAAVGATTGQ
jgi:hypothetical protein